MRDVKAVMTVPDREWHLSYNVNVSFAAELYMYIPALQFYVHVM